jgi:hypothetical protein
MMEDLKGISRERLIREADTRRAASIDNARNLRPKLIQRVTFDMTTARSINAPLNVSFPFSAFEVESCVDASGVSHSDIGAKVVMGSKDNYNINNYRLCKLGHEVEIDDVVNEGQIYWDAASGITMTIVFYLGMKGRSNSVDARISGGSVISDGASVTESGFDTDGAHTSVSVTGNAVMILPADPARTLAEIAVSGGDVRLGGSANTSLIGGRRVDGERWEYKSTAALYASKVSGAPVIDGLVYKSS